MTMKLSQHFFLSEATHSQTATRLGLDNTPTAEYLENIKLTALSMEIVRTLLGGVPILVSSWYRSPILNNRVGGSKNSDHMRGEAVDFTCPAFGTPFAICTRLHQFKKDLQYDQLIFEGTWVHISFVSTPLPTRKPRGQELTYMLDRSYRFGLIENRK